MRTLAGSLFRTVLITPVIVVLFAYDKSIGIGNDTRSAAVLEYATVEWIDLMPASDLEALLNPPDYVTEVVEGSDEDQPFGALKSTQAASVDDSYQRALVSTRVRSELDGQNIRIAGYVVPLEYDSNQAVTDFFLVPYYGACIHVPPPPPNQIILVHSEQGVEIEDMYTPYWLSGELEASLQENDLAASAYSLNLNSYKLYDGT